MFCLAKKGFLKRKHLQKCHWKMGPADALMYIYRSMNSWIFSDFHVRKNESMDLMGKKWIQLGGSKVDPFFSMRLVGELHSRKKETNVRNLKMMVLEFGDFSVNYEDCLVSMFVLESVHTCNVQSPLLKGLIIGGCQKPCLFTR